MEIEQNTEEWFKYRNSGIGASEAPIILGLSPYKTRIELYEQKINPVIEGNKSNFIIIKLYLSK